MMKYSFTKVKNPKNLSMKKATKLKKGKTVFITNYPSDKKKTYNRYFKIVLNKKQRVKIYSNAPSVSLLNAKGKPIRCSWEGTVGGVNYGKSIGYSEKKLKKGTYYLKQQFSGFSYVDKKNGTGAMSYLRWK